MKLPLSLIKQFVDLKETPKQLAELLTFAGVEVENIENEEPSFSGIVAARVEEVEKHPSADKLNIAKVNDGTQIFQVVCGASNCKKGMITAFAKIGATLLDDKNQKFQIKKATLRGVESFGMLCSSYELKLSSDQERIVEFSEEIKIGQDLSFLCEPVFDISLTPNLGHAMSALGIARELAALTKRKVKLPQISLKEESPISTQDKIDVEIQTQGCSRYSCRIVENVKIGPSPLWLQTKLQACNIKSINNVVDITNLVMLELGQPLHAFDFNKIEGKTITVSPNKNPRPFISLDKQDREIPKDAIVISDQKKPIAIAGIIGGLNSAVSEETTTLLIESAYFDPKAIYKASKALNFKTESGHRFEKGIDPSMTPVALDYACHLLQTICNGKVSQGRIDIQTQDFIPKQIACRVARVNSILGTQLSTSEVEDILKRLGFNLLKNEKKDLLIEVPTFRNDICQEIDLIEEVGRIYGYNNILRSSSYYRFSHINHSPSFTFESQIKSYLRQEGIFEVITCDLISKDLSLISQDLNIPKDSLIEVKYYKSIDQSVLRPSFLPSHLQTIKFNHDHKNMDAQIFEVGKIHFKKSDQFIEQTLGAITLFGKNRPYHFDPKPTDVDFFDLKGILENLFFSLGIKNYAFKASIYKAFHPFRQAEIEIDGIQIGAMGEVHPNLLTKFDIKKKVLFSEFNLNLLFKNKNTNFSFSEICPFPSSERDLTVPLKEKTEVAAVFKIINEIPSSLLENVFLLDLYKNNATFRFIYRDKTKTISFEEVEKEHSKISEEISIKI
ncbi:MAG: phenylalanine--tRNA ligase subunit beta [Chlamydiae bacterium]|nr:phenylalanine--tRNA ligase subunit beta [Chlamydiota bacterium]